MALVEKQAVTSFVMSSMMDLSFFKIIECVSRSAFDQASSKRSSLLFHDKLQYSISYAYSEEAESADAAAFWLKLLKLACI